MNQKIKNINSKENRVIANLVATYDITPENAQSVTSIDYLCIYEFEYNGKKHKYRTHQRDNFSPIPETIELGFVKDPSKAYKINNSCNQSGRKSSSSILIWGALILAVILIIYNIIRVLIVFEINISSLLVFICLLIIITRKSLKKQKSTKNRDVMIEEAMLNNYTVTAYLVKTRHLMWSSQDNPQMKQYYKERPYKGKYVYNYNGKKYTKTFAFSSPPPKSMRLFFSKNPKDIIHFTW